MDGERIKTDAEESDEINNLIKNIGSALKEKNMEIDQVAEEIKIDADEYAFYLKLKAQHERENKEKEEIANIKKKFTDMLQKAKEKEELGAQLDKVVLENLTAVNSVSKLKDEYAKELANPKFKNIVENEHGFSWLDKWTKSTSTVMKTAWFVKQQKSEKLVNEAQGQLLEKKKKREEDPWENIRPSKKARKD